MEPDKSSQTGEHEVIDFVSSITDAARLRIEENLPHGFVRLKVAEAERRQAQHDIRFVEDIVRELVRNSRDAGAGNILVAFQKEQGRLRRLVVMDDGSGIPEDMHQIVFEPRVTSKSEDFEEDRYGVHGRGMALFSIRSRATEAKIVSSMPGRGTAISLIVDTSQVPERSDQATLPRLENIDGKEVVGGGPHNVPRVLLEMSVDSRGVDFYLGSFAEVLATVRKLSVDCPGGGVGPLWSDVTAIDDAGELTGSSGEKLGLSVSVRNAYRVLNGEIAPLVPVYHRAAESRADDASTQTVEALRPRKPGHPRGPLHRLGRDDLQEISEGTRGIVERVVGRYYLRTSGPARVRRGRGRITVSFHITEEEGEDR